MFEYTTETIINDNKGHLSGGNRFVVDGTKLLVEGVGVFDKNNIKNVYKSSWVNEAKDKVTIKLKLTADTIVRLMIATRQEGLASSIYADAQLRHIKPFFYEIKATGTAATDAAALQKLIQKEMALTDFDFFKATVSSDTITLEADDVYTRFVEIRIDEVPSTSTVNVLTGYQNYVEKIAATRDELVKSAKTKNSCTITLATKGTEGNGNVRQIIKNLRLPTLANIDPFGLDFGGKPIPGGKYDIYTMLYETDRFNVGHDVVGSVGKSLTTHVFYVESGVTTAFDDLFTNDLSITVASAPTSGALTAKTPDNPQVG